MSKTVQGFGISNQQRQRVRGDLIGTFEDRNWIIRSEHSGLFWWSIGKLSGHAGPTLADVLRQMKKAYKAQTTIEADYGVFSDDQVNAINRLLRWEHMAVKGRLKLTGPHGAGEKEHFRVFITPPA